MIHRFRVQNFKSIVDVVVDLSPVTVLVGKSGTGKSSFVQALRFLRDVLISNQTLQQSWPQVRPVMASDAPTTFRVEFSVAGIEEKFQYELSINKSGPDQPPDNERLILGDRCLFHQANAAARLAALGGRARIDSGSASPVRSPWVESHRFPRL